jgi:hypothetical protein
LTENHDPLAATEADKSFWLRNTLYRYKMLLLSYVLSCTRQVAWKSRRSNIELRAVYHRRPLSISTRCRPSFFFSALLKRTLLLRKTQTNRKKQFPNKTPGEMEGKNFHHMIIII